MAVVTGQINPGKNPPLPTQPNPRYRYLRVEVAGRPPAMLVLGYLDPHPQGTVEVWYSAQREVIKIQNGRIVGTAGLETDWRSVQFPSPPPDWNDVATTGRTFQRLRDEMPGHRDAIADQVELLPWNGMPPITLPDSLPSDQARSYKWFRETTRDATANALPPAWFAWGLHLGQTSIVYSEQCLSKTLCLKLQRWPASTGTS